MDRGSCICGCAKFLLLCAKFLLVCAKFLLTVFVAVVLTVCTDVVFVAVMMCVVELVCKMLMVVN